MSTKISNVHDVVWNGFRDVFPTAVACRRVSRAGVSAHAAQVRFATLSDGVLVWTMSNPRWT